MADGTITIEIKGDNSDLNSVLNEVTKTIDQVTKGWDKTTTSAVNNVEKNAEKALEETGATATKTGDAVYDVFNKVTGFLISKKVANAVMGFVEDSVELASALQEVQNVVDTTFGTRGANQIEQWANLATKSFGLSELQAKTYASTFGNIFKQMGVPEQRITKMSTDLAGLAADMASFYNMNFDEAFNKIVSSMNGQSRPLAGIVDMSVDALSEYAKGLDLVWSKMDAGEKSMLRYQYLMEHTTDIQGDFGKTSDSYENSIRAIQTTIEQIQTMFGEALLPVITAIASAIRTVLGIFLPGEKTFEDKINDLSTEAQNEIDVINGTAQAASDLTDVLARMDQENGGDFLAAYAKDAEGLATQFAIWLVVCSELTGVMPGLTNIINTQTGEITGGTAALKDFITQWQKTSNLDVKADYAKKMRAEFDSEWGDIKELEVKAGMARYLAETKRARFEALGEPTYYTEYDPMANAWVQRADKEWLNAKNDADAAEREAKRLSDEYNRRSEAYEKAKAEFDEKINALYNYDTSPAMEAGQAVGDAVADGLNASIPGIAAAVGEINSLVGSVGGVTTRINSFKRSGAGGGGGGFDAVRGISGYASGLDYVPANNYLAMLHAGEGVLTAEENRVWRNFKYGDRPADSSVAGAIAGSMGNMQIVWRGRVVADVLSEQQGDSYRALERSGWKS